MTTRPTLVRAEGIHVWDRDGQRYLDATSGAFCVQLGYSRPDLVRAMTEAAARLPHARPSVFESEEGVEYRRALLDAVGSPYTRIVLTSSGSEAVDVALKAAHLYQRAVGGAGRGVRYLAGHYHGATLGALGVTGWDARRGGYEGLVGPARTLTEREMQSHGGDATPQGDGPPTAIILETIPAAGLGAPLPPPGYLARIRSLCDASGALWIADEVLTGFGRVGSMFAWQRLQGRRDSTGAGAGADAKALPDLIVFGKGAGAGFAALAGVIMTDRVAAALDAANFRHTQTYGGNPIACAVGRRVLDALREEEIFDRVRKLEGAFESTLRGALDGLPGVDDIRGMGFLCGIELKGADPAAVAEGCRERGILVHAAPGGPRHEGGGLTPGGPGAGAGTILLAPPLIAEATHFEEIAEALRASIAVLAAPR